MQTRILGKYQVVEGSSSEYKYGLYNDNLYRIEIVAKTPSSGKYSDIAKRINTITHKNISNLQIEEDYENFYFVDKDFGEGYSDLKAEWFGNNYSSLIKCYIQIIDAVDYIHQNGFYHGNINPQNIIVDRNDNAYLLDFGRCYIYACLSKNPNGFLFYAPEQVEKNECYQESDIYSLGLCMLKLLLESNFKAISFSDVYKGYSSLENIYDQISEQKSSLDETNASLFLLIKRMLEKSPDNRVKLNELRSKLSELLNKIQPCKNFAILIMDNIIDQWYENHDISDRYGKYGTVADIQKRIDGYRAYLEFDKDKNQRDRIQISIGELTFLCSAQKDQGYFFCFNIQEIPRVTEKLQKYGLPTDYRFKIGTEMSRYLDCDDPDDVIDELAQKYEQKVLENKRYEFDKKSIVTEEDLLKAEKKTIDEKKNSHKVKITELDKGKDTIVFKYADDAEENAETTVRRGKDFNQNQDVVITEIDGIDNSHICGKVVGGQASFSVTVKLENYGILKSENSKNDTIKLKKGKEFCLSYDYVAEEVMWSKRKNALDRLQNGSTAIPYFLRKINRPEEFKKNDLVDIDKFYNPDLDDNQKLAVQKSLSLSNDCEVLIIQGPPGTGKTTTITEIVMQLLKTRPNEKILVASQSNQAVDNVLEKICIEEDKILRIGNDEKKIRKKAQEFLPQKVLNKLIKENIERIKKKPVTHTNPSIQNELRLLQNDFKEKLQYLTSDMSKSNGKQETKESNLATLFTKNIRLIFGTLLGISSWGSFREITFDTVIVDEAGRATLSELLVPCIKAKKLILVGDHKQLAPVIDDDVMDKIDDKNEAKTSFFQRLFERIEKADRENLRHTLTYNYRAERRICDLYSNAFYDGALKTADSVNIKKQHNLSYSSSVVWYDTGMIPDKEDKQCGTGKINHCNARCINRILEKIKGEMGENKEKYDIGIITPYRAQKDLLTKRLQVKKNFNDYDIEIGTVDSFQGSDRDIIIYDCVRSSRIRNKTKIDFIADEKRLNVSLSRAKKLLIIVGDMEFLYRAQCSDKNNPFVSIIEYINANKGAYQIIREK